MLTIGQFNKVLLAINKAQTVPQSAVWTADHAWVVLWINVDRVDKPVNIYQTMWHYESAESAPVNK